MQECQQCCRSILELERITSVKMCWCGEVQLYLARGVCSSALKQSKRVLIPALPAEPDGRAYRDCAIGCVESWKPWSSDPTLDERIISRMKTQERGLKMLTQSEGTRCSVLRCMGGRMAKACSSTRFSDTVAER